MCAIVCVKKSAKKSVYDSNLWSKCSQGSLSLSVNASEVSKSANSPFPYAREAANMSPAFLEPFSPLNSKFSEVHKSALV